MTPGSECNGLSLFTTNWIKRDAVRVTPTKPYVQIEIIAELLNIHTHAIASTFNGAYLHIWVCRYFAGEVVFEFVEIWELWTYVYSR